MALVINTNLPSLSARTQLRRSTDALGRTLEHLASGQRINRAADDAAGLGMSERLNATRRGLQQALRNAQDGISVLQTTEGATNEVANIIKRIRELAVQAASDTLGSVERGYTNTEYAGLSEEIDRIARVTKFNDVSLTDDARSLAVQVGTLNSGDDRIEFSTLNLLAASLGLNNLDLSNTANALQALDALDTALSSVNTYRANLGASQNRIEAAIRNLENYTENVAAAESRIRDADFAFETAQMAKHQIIQQSGVAVLGQANAINSLVTRLLG
jgi:flagellin